MAVVVEGWKGRARDIPLSRVGKGMEFILALGKKMVLDVCTPTPTQPAQPGGGVDEEVRSRRYSQPCSTSPYFKTS